MSAHTTFTETIYKARGKKGNLPAPDASGYYTFMIGALNCYNSIGEYYIAHRVVDLFKESSAFVRRIEAACLYGELGHPRREPGMSYADYYARMIDIYEPNICVHYRKIWLDMNYGRNNPEVGNPEMIAIMAELRPHGPHAAVLQASLDTPDQNTAFSIRSLMDTHQRNGRTERELTSLITFDHVVMPGIKQACKAFAPGVESNGLILQTGQEHVVHRDILRNLVSTDRASNIFAKESSQIVADEIRSLLCKKVNPALLKW